MRRLVSYAAVVGVIVVFYHLIGKQFQDITGTVAERSGNILKDQGVYCKVVKVYDGDTFKCRLEDGKEIKVRLIGVDTPEVRRNKKLFRDAERTGRDVNTLLALGRKASQFTKSLIPPGTRVVLETDVELTDRYGRILAYVYLPDGRMLNEVLLREGYAMVYTFPPNVRYVDRFLEAQRKARREGKGLWKDVF